MLGQYGDSYRISINSEIIDYSYNQTNYYGISGQYFITKNLSLNYSYLIGKNCNHEFAVHVPGAINLLVLSPPYPDYFLFVLLIPEGGSYHFYPNKNFETEFFLNPLGTDYNIMDNERFTLTGNLGVKAYAKYNNFSISPYAGIKYIYTDATVRPIIGISINTIIY
ncbi:MAG: hypothetical protein Kow0068_14600 [Marinilabiliales bacterium]